MSKEFKNTVQAAGKQALIDHLCDDVSELVQMHYALILLYREESYLKKHHKAYLHVRDKADEACKRDVSRMVVLMHNTLEMMAAVKEAEETAEAVGQAALDQESADDVKKNVKIEMPDELSCNDCPYQEECGNAGMKHGETDGKLDVFALPEGRVYMSTKTLGVMQDDMLALTEGIDQLVSIFRALMRGQSVPDKIVQDAVEANAGLSEDVFSRWDNADLISLA
ncbi:MAG: hypothetical protein LUC95_02340 [Lachnospiraceae bacterium]|nr:hypothetical protein [Lachnospiraceae bacterium]